MMAKESAKTCRNLRPVEIVKINDISVELTYDRLFQLLTILREEHKNICEMIGTCDDISLRTVYSKRLAPLHAISIQLEERVATFLSIEV